MIFWEAIVNSPLFIVLASTFIMFGCSILFAERVRAIVKRSRSRWKTKRQNIRQFMGEFGIFLDGAQKLSDIGNPPPQHTIGPTRNFKRSIEKRKEYLPKSVKVIAQETLNKAQSDFPKFDNAYIQGQYKRAHRKCKRHLK